MASADELPAGKESTYSGFIGLLKRTVPSIAVLTLIVILLIS